MPNQTSVERRLAAILAADVVSYSRLMETDEVGTLNALKAIRRELVDPAIVSHHGRIVKTTGDGFLTEFASVVAAVSCAVTIQRGMVLRNSNVPENKRLVFRIGINVGDVIIEHGDIFGDGVNIAARLEAICEPGGLCISRTANDQIMDKLPLPFIDRGEQVLKNIARAIGVYQLAPSEIAGLPEETTQASINPTAPVPAGFSEHRRSEPETRPSLAVLPFDNLSRASELEDFCDGLVEDTITALSRFRWINVVSRNSSFAQKGRAVDIRQIARDLDARFILEGSVRKSDRRIRITAQLIDGTSGNHIWAERYDRDYSALFDLQDEVTRDIVASLEYVLWIALVRGNRHSGANAPKNSLLTAGWHVVECTHADNRAAIEQATAALKENPRSVAAYQYIANACIAEIYLGWTEDPQADVESLLEAARRAIALSPADSLSQGLYGGALALSEDHDGALACVRRAAALNANSVNVLGPCGTVLSLAGEAREANEMIDRMLRLTPAHYYRAGFLSTMSLNYLQLGEPERGLPLTSEALKLKPEAPCCHIVHAQILKTIGRSESAEAAVAKAYRLRPDLNEALVRAVFPYRDRSVPDRLVTLLGVT